jgi:hypothetical protein
MDIVTSGNIFGSIDATSEGSLVFSIASIVHTGSFVSANAEIGNTQNAYSIVSAQSVSLANAEKSINHNGYSVLKLESGVSGSLVKSDNQIANSKISGEALLLIDGEISGSPHGIIKSNLVAQFLAASVSTTSTLSSSSINGNAVFSGNASINSAKFVTTNSIISGTGNVKNIHSEILSYGLINSTVSGVSVVYARPEKILEILGDNRLNLSGEAIFSVSPNVLYTENSSKRYFLVEKRTLFGPDSLDHVKDPDELY